MKTPRIPLIVALMAAGSGAVIFSIWNRPPAPESTVTGAGAQPPPTAVAVPFASAATAEVAKPPEAPGGASPSPSASSLEGAENKGAVADGGKKAPYEPGPFKYKNAKNPAARKALGRVGADLEADAYWMTAINDPTLSANERKDLIEDLNEDGISDPHQPTAKDLPLITSRLHLIEQLAPSAMDEVNAEAFREAHKDLLAMYEKLNRR